jgi:hypothetical protein
MKELKIEIPEGYEIDTEKSTFEKIVFKEVKKSIGWEGIGVINGYYVSSFSSVEELDNTTARSANRNVWPTLEEAEACLALSQLCQWRDKYNGDWKPAWSSPSIKYVIFASAGKINVGRASAYRKLLAFRTEEVRDKFLNDFSELIEKALPLL